MSELNDPPTRSRFGWIKKSVILLCLLGAGWYGHTFHWSLPFLNAHASKPQSHVSIPKPADPLTESVPPPSNSPIPATQELTAIEFPTAAAAKKCGIETASASERAVDDYLKVHGVVDYDQSHFAELSVRVPGVVWKVLKRVGDNVEAGDILAIIDSAEVGQEKADLLEAFVTHRLKQASLKRLEELKSVTTGRALYEANAEVELSRARRFIALQKLGSLGFHLRLDEIENISSDELADRLQMLGLPAEFKSESNSANLIPLIAPFKGIITKCEIVRGESVSPNIPQYTLANVSRMWVNLDVRQEDAELLKLGAEVDFQSEVDSRIVVGKLTWIGTDVDPRTRTVKARAEVDNPFIDPADTDPTSRRLLQAGMFGSAKILMSRRPTAVMVPNEALHWQWEIGRELVFIPSKDGKSFTPRVVEKGLVKDGYVEIRDGLVAGEPIAVSGCRILSSELSQLLQQRSGDNAHGIRSFR